MKTPGATIDYTRVHFSKCLNVHWFKQRLTAYTSQSYYIKPEMIDHYDVTINLHWKCKHFHSGKCGCKYRLPSECAKH